MPSRAPAAESTLDTATRALDAAERLVQTMGFNWFSYADIAKELNIRKASLHHHFPAKSDLGTALIVRYRERFSVELRRIGDSRTAATGKLAGYVKLYESVLRGERMCLCGMLAAEYASLPVSMQTEIRHFFDLNQQWLAGVVEEGRQANLFHNRGTANEIASMLLSALEGAMLVARPYGDLARFASAAEQILESLTAPSKAPGRGSRRAA